MKRIVQVAVAVFACSAGAAWSQQSQEQIQQAQNTEAAVVAQAGPGSGERIAISREEAKPRKASMHDLMDLAGDGVYPSRGGPLDD
jgi:hypothetical protein